MSSPAWLRKSLTRVVLTVVVGSVVVACAGGTRPSSTGAGAQPSSAPQPPGPAWKGVLGQVQPNGTVSLATALAAFTLAVGPLPGVTTPAGTAGQLIDGTVGVRWVIGHWAQLTAPQQQAVEQYLVVPAKAKAAGAQSGGTAELVSYTPSHRPELTGAVSASGYLAEAQHFRGLIAADLGRDTPQDIKVVINTTQKEGNAYAYTTSFDSSWGFSGKAAHCVIYINPSLYTSKDAGLATDVVAHEMFHCFQADDFSSLYAFGLSPSWIVEGQAEWVGQTLEPVDDNWWVPYLTNLSTTPNPTNINSVLFKRSYDAVGFYAHMAESGINPWGRFDDMLKAGGNVSAYDKAVNEAFRKDWASSVARRPALGAGWDTTGPGIPSYIFEPHEASVGNGTTINGKVAPYAIRLVEANVTADVVSVTVSGDYGRLHAANGAEYDGADLHGAEFCVSNCQQSDCTAALKRLPPGPIWLAVTGDAAGSTYSITGKQTSCECLVGTWTVTNEVVAAAHLSGGAGITWTIGPDGTLTINYAGSAPIVGAGISVQYSGTENAHVTFTSDPAAASGTWTIGFDAGSLVATTDVQGYKTTRSVPSVPGASGTWTCQGNMMTTTYGNGVGQMISAHRP